MVEPLELHGDELSEDVNRLDQGRLRGQDAEGMQQTLQSKQLMMKSISEALSLFMKWISILIR
jgi:hypothetical protein